MEHEKKKYFIVNICYWTIILLGIYIFLRYGFTHVSPFVIAFIIATCLNGMSQKIANQFGIKKKIVSLVVLIVFYCIVVLLMTILGIKIFGWLTDAMMSLPQTYRTSIEPLLMLVFDNIENAFYNVDPATTTMLNDLFLQFSQSLYGLLTSISVTVVSVISNRATLLPTVVLKIFLTLMSSFFIAADYDKIKDFILRQFPDNWKNILGEASQFFARKLFVLLKSYLTIMSITFVEIAIGLTIFRVENAVLIAMGIAIFDIVPILGTGGVVIPWAIISLLQGNTVLGIQLLILYAIVLVVRNIMEPRIVGSHMGLHPLVTLMAMFVGMWLFGMAGFFTAPILLTFAKHLSDIGIIKLHK